MLLTSEDGVLIERIWEIQVIDGIDAGKRVRLHESPSLIGAAPAATLVLRDDTVSRYHAEVDLLADGVHLRDLDSTNGSFSGSARVKELFLSPGDEVTLGRTLVRIVARDAPAELGTDNGFPEVLPNIVSRSSAMRSLAQIARVAADSESYVLLEGPPGCGKGALAQAMHAVSRRRDKPLLKLRFPPGLPEDKANVLLFGITSPRDGQTTPGGLERASGGALLVRGLELLPPPTQHRLTSALEAGEVMPVGNPARKRIDVRLFTSVSEAPERLPFEPALLRHLGVVRLKVPGLDARREDLVPLALRFLGEAGYPEISIGPELRALLERARWPKNVSELRTCVRVLAGSLDGTGHPLASTLRPALVSDLLRTHRGDVSSTAEALKLEEIALWRYLAQRELQLDEM